MFVCMFYLSPRSRIIVSIWETSETTLCKRRKKGERKKKNKKQKFSLFVTNNCAYCIVWRFLRKFLLLYFLFLYFIRQRKGCFDLFMSFIFSWTFVSFPFLSFPFLFLFGNNKQVSLCETRKYGSDLSYSLFWVFFSVVIAKKHVAARVTQVRLFVFHVTVVFSVGVSPFICVSSFSRKSESAFACATHRTEGEMCFTQNIRSRIRRKQTKK